MTTDIQTTTTEQRDLATVAESLVTRGDLSGLTPGERARHYVRTCEGLGLNPHSQPFSFLTLQGKLIMYANRGAADQLAAMHKVNRRITRGPEEITLGGQKLVICVAEASMPNGRVETSIATVPMTDPVNVLMKAETKAKRRVTLSILGLGMLDETEVETIPGAVRIDSPRLDIVRDDAPAQPAAVDALDAFRASLSDAHTLADIAEAYQRADLGGTSAKPVTDMVVERAASLGYYLNAAEAKALLGGTLDPALTTAYERLAHVESHADDEHGDAVVADIVRIVRDYRVEPKATTTRVWNAAAQTAAWHLRCDEKAAKARLTAALTPPPPPTGTDAPPASNDGAASAHGDAIAPAQTAGAQALRTVLDSDVSHITIAGTWRADPMQWSGHLASKSTRREIENSVACNGAALGPQYIALAAERIVAIDATRPKPPGVARLTVIGVTQTLERLSLDGSRARAAVAAQAA